MACRGVRGATTVEVNSAEEIRASTRELLMAMVAENGIAVEDIASVIFTSTSDLDAAYPAVVAREMGWGQTPLLCTQEMRVVGSLARCIRVLLHWNTEEAPSEVIHIYLREAQALRPDLARQNADARRNADARQKPEVGS